MKRVIYSLYIDVPENEFVDNIEGHINCVSSIEEFKSQLPDNANVLIEDEVKDERGIRFMLIGQYE